MHLENSAEGVARVGGAECLSARRQSVTGSSAGNSMLGASFEVESQGRSMFESKNGPYTAGFGARLGLTSRTMIFILCATAIFSGVNSTPIISRRDIGGTTEHEGEVQAANWMGDLIGGSLGGAIGDAFGGGPLYLDYGNGWQRAN